MKTYYSTEVHHKKQPCEKQQNAKINGEGSSMECVVSTATSQHNEDSIIDSVVKASASKGVRRRHLRPGQDSNMDGV